MIKFRSKLLLAIVAFTAVSMVGLGVLLVQLFGNYNYEHYENHLKRQLHSITDYMENNGGISAFTGSDDTDMTAALKLVDDDLAIISNDGKVIYLSGTPQGLPLNRHKQILESIAQEGKEGHREISGGFNVHYFWSPIKIENGTTEGYVVLSNQFDEMKELNYKSWLILLGVVAFSLIIVSIIAGKIASRFTKPIEAATDTAIELAKGNYRARTYENPTDETKLLSASINILARNLQEMETSREMEQDRLFTLIENIGSGVLLIDSKGSITLMNKTYKQLFNVSSSDLLYHLYYEAIPFKEVILLIEEIFMTEKSVKKQMMLSLTIERKNFEVYGAPIISHSDEWKGIVLVFHDITELKKLELMRQDFVANVSHELRTPITSIKGFSETLLDGDLKDERTMRDFLTIILNESDRLQALIQELLELSKIEKQEFVLNISKLDLNALLTETAAMFTRKAEKKGISLQIQLASHPVIINADPYRIKQVLINLISNALNYTPAEGKVEVLIRDNEKYAYVEVKDTGIGIDKKEIPRIFERFYRVDRARSRNSGGTGLGLAIVKHLIEAHKGELEVISEPGIGTNFIIKLRK
ncbi:MULTISPECIES: two-component system histidine kinase PnpS [Bacillus]|uniref:two-component system histidine kinase PnpS n=1 Tax=Bacillus TaxID=1386 RepID=UPI0002E42865|nr:MULTISPECIES: ATP-binding protein [Bacillus]